MRKFLPDVDPSIDDDHYCEALAEIILSRQIEEVQAEYRRIAQERGLRL